MTIVKVRNICGNIIEVTGMDAVNNSPVLDIKPYVKKIFTKKKATTPKWMKVLLKSLKKNRPNNKKLRST